MSHKAYETFSPTHTPQSEPIPGQTQVQNNAGGYTYSISKWSQLQRFLILGSEGGTYYVKEKPLTRENALNVLACLIEDGTRVVELTVAVSDAGRAPKNDPAIFVLALAASDLNPLTRSQALAALPKVCRIPTHLFHFLTYLKGMRGWGRQLRTAIGNWYLRFDDATLAYQLVKYQNRDGWSNRDVLRKAHLTGATTPQHSIFRWALGADAGARTVKRGERYSQYTTVAPPTGIIHGFERAKTTSTVDLPALIREYGLTREMVPTQTLNSPSVWEALLEKMPLMATIRSLGKMSAVGLLEPLSTAARIITTRLSDQDYIIKSRVHPLTILLALRTYQSGHGEKGTLQWSPVREVVDALDTAFYLSFGSVEPTNKAIMLALDVSGSMYEGHIAGSPLRCSEGVAALALITANVESRYLIVGFTGGRPGIRELSISPRQRLDDVIRTIRSIPFGPTDCALPVIYAKNLKSNIDAFVVYTDNEAWYGNIHPSQALRDYRRAKVPHAKLIVVGMTSTGFSIADPQDPGMLDVVGFDTATPQAISSFIQGLV